MPGPMDDASDFYLDIAHRALKHLDKLRGRPRASYRDGEEGFRRSSHYRHAVTCVVFAAVAVEHATKRLMFERIMRSGPPYNRLLVSTWKKVVSTPERRAFLEGGTRLDAALLNQIDGLFGDRNSIVHLGLDMKMKAFPVPGRPPMHAPSIRYPMLREEVIVTARRAYSIAEQAVTALREAIKDPEWWPVPDVHNARVQRFYEIQRKKKQPTTRKASSPRVRS